MKNKIYETFSAEETLALARRMGQTALSGSIICLTGDLGTGKTVFTKGFALGLGIDEPITSPTFNIVNTYTGGRLTLHHFDVYRIEEPEEMYEIGYEEYFFGDAVCIVEWPQVISELLPPDAIQINIEKNLDKGVDYRKISVTQKEDDEA